jgi:hypothetical protein
MATLLLGSLLLSLGSLAQPQSDLRISLARVESGDTKPTIPTFVITLENQSDRDFVLVLGAVVGKKLYPNAISLLLTDPGGQVFTLRYRGPLRVGGRVDPYIVGLPSRATYVLRVSLAQFTSPYTGEGRTAPPAEGDLDPKLPPGSYTIQATVKAPAGNPSDPYGNRLMDLWAGTASSDVLRISIP